MALRTIDSFHLIPLDGVSSSLKRVSDGLDDLATCDLGNHGYVRSVLEDMSTDIQEAVRWIGDFKGMLKNGF